MNFMEKEKPIGVFDSGIGGLTVVKRIAAALPEENIIYFGDTARVPYGSKSNDTVIEYSIEDAKFLMQKNVKAIVVACNTASSVAMDELKKLFDVPLIGMIEPGAQTAIKSTKNKRVGVIGTRATVANKAYSNKIRELNPEIKVFETACPLFVPLAEEGWINHKATYEIAEEYLKGRYKIEVIDLLKNPQLAEGDQILAIPTLVRKLPPPIRKIIGDLSNTERVLVGLDIQPMKTA